MFFSKIEIEAKHLHINVFSVKNGKGLEADQKILVEALKELQCHVRSKEFNDPVDQKQTADINIFFEILTPEWFPLAKQNWFIPNPEFYSQDVALLNDVDLILCRTKESEKIFNKLDLNTYFLGFTSIDCYDSNIQKDYKLFFHLAGGSAYKGTSSILRAWMKNPHFPFLTIVKHAQNAQAKVPNICWIPYRLDTSVLRNFQNCCGIHLCLSETEGFGHYLMEAMSTGAIVVTTDAPPMNEFVQSFLVPYTRKASQSLANLYYADEDALAKTINTIMKMPLSELKKMGKKNREIYLQRTEEFKQNLEDLILKYTN